MQYLNTPNPDVKLVPPNIERDAQLGVQWLAGERGRETLKLMGVKPSDNKPTTLKAEKERVRNFIESKDQLNWMIEYNGVVVGSVWVDLKATDYLMAPSIHIMIGNPSARRAGVGSAACSAAIEHVKVTAQYTTMFSRHLTINSGSRRMLTKLGFVADGNKYTDKDGLTWQNVIMNF